MFNFVLYGINELTVTISNLLEKKGYSKYCYIVDSNNELLEKYKNKIPKEFNEPIISTNLKEILEKYKISTLVFTKTILDESLIKLCVDFEVHFLDSFHRGEQVGLISNDTKLNELAMEKKLLVLNCDSKSVFSDGIASKMTKKVKNLKSLKFYHSSNLINLLGDLNVIKDGRVESIAMLKNIKSLDHSKTSIPTPSNEIYSTHFNTKIDNISSYMIVNYPFNFIFYILTLWLRFILLPFWLIFKFPFVSFLFNKLKKFLKNFESPRTFISIKVIGTTENQHEIIGKIEGNNEMLITSKLVLQLLENINEDKIRNFGVQTVINAFGDEIIDDLNSRLSFQFDQELRFQQLEEKIENLEKENSNLRQSLMNIERMIQQLKSNEPNQVKILTQSLSLDQIAKEGDFVSDEEEDETSEDSDEIQKILEKKNIEISVEVTTNEEVIPNEIQDSKQVVIDGNESDDEEEITGELNKNESKNEAIGEKIQQFQELVIKTASEDLKNEKEKKPKRNPYIAMAFLISILSIGIYYAFKLYNSMKMKN
jgi:hypothetical protein